MKQVLIIYITTIHPPTPNSHVPTTKLVTCSRMSLRSSTTANIFYRRLGRSPLAAHGSPAVLQYFPGGRETNNNNAYPFANPSQTIIRTYYYFPTTWPEVQERFERWIEHAEHRFVKVQLLSRQRKRNDAPKQLISRFVGRTHATWNSFYQKKIAKQQGLTNNNHSNTSTALQQHSPGVEMPPPPPPLSMRLRYLGWKTRRKEQYHGWKARRSEQFKSWKASRQEQYQGWKQRRRQEWKDIQHIIVREYSKPEWFDDLGRPVTSKDSLGRFVNPWQSQSTNGLHSPFTILRWRWERAVRFFQIDLAEYYAKKILPVLSGAKAIQPPQRSRRSIDSSSPLPIPSPQNDHEIACTWIGHSTCYIQMNGFSMLSDPIFSTKSSPYQEEWIPIGVTREVPPSHSIDYLVNHSGGTIDLCFISHDHYDHMDLNSVMKLAPHVEQWVVPLGIGKWLTKKAGIKSNKIVELKWWQQVGFTKSTTTPTTSSLSTKILTGDSSGEEYHENNFDISVTCCPASHWSSRTMFDRNHRLWGSFAVTSPTQRLFLCGDTGLPETFPLFRQIGDALGPFDLACIPIGAYEPDHYNKMAHMNPEEAIQAHQEIMSKYSLGIHWGTFALGDEPLDEPPLKLQEALEKKEASANIAPFDTVAHGMTVMVNHQKQLLPATENDLMIYNNSMMQYQDMGCAATTIH